MDILICASKLVIRFFSTCTRFSVIQVSNALNHYFPDFYSKIKLESSFISFQFFQNSNPKHFTTSTDQNISYLQRKLETVYESICRPFTNAFTSTNVIVEQFLSCRSLLDTASMYVYVSTSTYFYYFFTYILLIRTLDRTCRTHHNKFYFFFKQILFPRKKILE